MKKWFSKITPTHIAVLSIFILMMLFSTRVVMSMRGLLIWEIDPITIPEKNPDITYEIYYITNSDNVDGEVEVAGYAFMETAEDNPEKRIDLILQSKDHTYIVPSELSVQHNLSAETTGKMIQGVRHTFSAKFSRLLLPDDVYELALYCYENNSAYGYVGIGLYLKKGDSFQPSVLRSLEDESRFITESDGIDLTDIDSIPSDPVPWHYMSMEDCNGDHMHLTGWIAIVTLDSREAKSFVTLTDENGRTRAYTTISYEDDLVEEEVGSTLANHGFFDAYIPLEDLQAGDYTVQLVVQYPEMTRKPEISHALKVSEDRKVTYIP